jgi:hypothetical protein
MDGYISPYGWLAISALVFCIGVAIGFILADIINDTSER